MFFIVNLLLFFFNFTL